MTHYDGISAKPHRFEHIFWVDASNKETLEQSYKSIASQLSTNSELNLSLNEIISRLERLDNEWLLLFDGADEVDIIAGLLPPGNQGNVLYTSRNPVLKNLPKSQICEIDVMDENEAVILLLKAARLEDSFKTYADPAKFIAEELGFLALAVDQAGAYIANGECSIHDFLTIFRSHRQELMQNDVYRGASLYDRSVYASWDLSYNAMIKSTNIDALWILKIFAFFHNENIAIDIFKLAAENLGAKVSPEEDRSPQDGLTQHCHFPYNLFRLSSNGEWDSFAFRRGIRTLLNSSLIHQDGSGCYFSMHSLVHRWIYDLLMVKDQTRYSYVAYSILANSICLQLTTENYNFRSMLLPHINSCQHRTPSILEPSINIEDKRKIILVFYEAGRWKEAEEQDLQVLEIRKRMLGEEHPDTLKSMDSLARIYHGQGQTNAAIQLMTRVVQLRREKIGLGHPHTISASSTLESWQDEKSVTSCDR